MDDYGLQLTVAPTAEPVTLAEAKLWCRVDTDAEDGLLTALVKAARQYAERAADRSLMPQTWALTLPGFPEEGGRIELPRPPLISVLSVVYVAADGTSTTLAADQYEVNAAAEPGCLWPSYSASVWPVARELAVAVTATYRAGYSDASLIPEGVRLAMRLMVATWYRDREETGKPNTAIDALLQMAWPGNY